MKGKVPIIALTRPAMLIGRHSECDVQLTDLPVSRFHCCIALAYDRIVIRDLGSRNGLRVNGIRVEEARLFSGDEIAMGPVIYRLVPESEASESSIADQRKAPPTPATLPAGAPSPRNPQVPPTPSSTSDDAGLELDLIPLDD
jgi:pSer/pThr/pTyr-binding forkhead associated (FHA) protein